MVWKSVFGQTVMSRSIKLIELWIIILIKKYSIALCYHTSNVIWVDRSFLQMLATRSIPDSSSSEQH